MNNICISLFDYSGIMLKPWAEAGYSCYCYDIQHEITHQNTDGIWMVKADLSSWDTVPAMLIQQIPCARFVSAFPPCDHLAVSGARWFTGKGLRALSNSISLFATAAEICQATIAPYMIENPVSTISTYWRKPDHTFHPWMYDVDGTERYPKKTCLWVGNRFVMPPPLRDEPPDDLDDRIHKMPPSKDRGLLRSKTPLGFAKAVYDANKGEFNV